MNNKIGVEHNQNRVQQNNHINSNSNGTKADDDQQ